MHNIDNDPFLPFTVRDLREIFARYPDDMPVTVYAEVEDGCYVVCDGVKSVTECDGELLLGID